MSLTSNAELGTAIPPEAKPKRTRKAKAAPPKPVKQRKPRRSILSEIEAMGPTHLAAYRTLAQGSPQFTRDVVAMLCASYRLAVAALDLTAKEEAVERARDRVAAARDEVRRADATRARLDSLAKSIAHARGDVPEAIDAPAEADLRGVEIP